MEAETNTLFSFQSAALTWALWGVLLIVIVRFSRWVHLNWANTTIPQKISEIAFSSFVAVVVFNVLMVAKSNSLKHGLDIKEEPPRQTSSAEIKDLSPEKTSSIKSSLRLEDLRNEQRESVSLSPSKDDSLE